MAKAVVSLADIIDLNNKGYNDSQIAEMYGVTRQYISWIKDRYGALRTPRQRALEHWPLEVSAHQSQQSPYRRLRDHGEYVATKGKGMSADQLKRLQTFWRKLRTHVVEYDPNIPPEPGFANIGGFALRKRTAADGHLMLRVNEHTRLSAKARRIWSMDTIPAAP